MAAITVIAYAVGQAMKAWGRLDRWIPTVCAALGGALGVAGLYIMPGFPAGDTITATFEVVKKGEEVTKPDGTVKFSPGRIVMKATAVNQRGEVVVEGEACSMAAREKVDCSRF